LPVEKVEPRDSDTLPEDSLRVNMTLWHETATMAKELKSLGIARSTADLVNQAIRLLFQKVADERLKVARMRILENRGEE